MARGAVPWTPELEMRLLFDIIEQGTGANMTTYHEISKKWSA